MSMPSYPAREPCFAYRFCRLLAKRTAAQEIGAEACYLLTVIALTEDARRYSGPVTFYNMQLAQICGFDSENRLNRHRQRAIDAGWLHYEPGGKRRAGVYWVIIPSGSDGDDSPLDEGIDRDLHLQNGGTNGGENGFHLQNGGASGGRNGGEAGDNRRIIGGPPTLSPIPNPMSGESLPPPKGTGSKVSGHSIDIPAELDTPDFRTAWIDLCDERRDRKQNLTPRGWAALLKKLSRYGPAIAIQAIEESIANGWQGIFPEKITDGKHTAGTNARRNGRAMEGSKFRSEGPANLPSQLAEEWARTESSS